MTKNEAKLPPKDNLIEYKGKDKPIVALKISFPMYIFHSIIAAPDITKIQVE